MDSGAGRAEEPRGPAGRVLLSEERHEHLRRLYDEIERLQEELGALGMCECGHREEDHLDGTFCIAIGDLCRCDRYVQWREYDKLLGRSRMETYALMVALRRYGKHDMPCLLRLQSNDDALCICGLDTAIARIEEGWEGEVQEAEREAGF